MARVLDDEITRSADTLYPSEVFNGKAEQKKYIEIYGLACLDKVEEILMEADDDINRKKEL